MTVKNPLLDEKIIRAAKEEFMEHGFQKASLRKIAQRAGLSTGALYTRYKNKDVLFCSLIEKPLMEIGREMAPMKALYAQSVHPPDPEKIMQVIRREEEICLRLLFAYYEECILFFCCSGGSSVEQKLKRLMEEKAFQTAEYFRQLGIRDVDTDGLQLICSQQYHYYRQILLKGYSREKAVSCMRTVWLFTEAGWKELLDRLPG